jgi:hypothetical protein
MHELFARLNVRRLGRRAAAPWGLLALAGSIACQPNASGEVRLTVASLDIDDSSRSAVTTFTPTTFQLPVSGVRLLGPDGDTQIYEPPSGAPIEFVRTDGSSALSANHEAAVGTYDALQVEIGGTDGRYVIVAGCATLASEEHCTRADPSESSVGGTPEPVRVRSANSIDGVLDEPFEVLQDSVVDLGLYYDLTHAVSFLDEPGPTPDDPGFGRIGFGDDTTVEVRYPPMFAFLGEPPPVEVYEIRLTTDPDPSVAPDLGAYFQPPEAWHVRMWMFFDDAGEPLARRDVWVAEPSADGAALVSMFTQAATVERNDDGTYVIAEVDPDPDFQWWRLDAFERASHTGTATWTTPEGTKSIGYDVARLQ